MTYFAGDCGADNQVSPVDNLLWRNLIADRVPLPSQILGGVAQSAEQAAHNRCVTGSSPVSATRRGSVVTGLRPVPGCLVAFTLGGRPPDPPMRTSPAMGSG